MLIRISAALIIAVSLSGCATSYHPLSIDQSSGRYATGTEVDASEILKFKTDVNPKIFSIVLLTTATSFRSELFNFKIRTALAQAGITNVYSSAELLQLAADKNFKFTDDKITNEELKKFSANVAPVLIINMVMVASQSSNECALQVVDGRTNDPLLLVDHSKFVLGDFESEILYPVLNEFRSWKEKSIKGASA